MSSEPTAAPARRPFDWNMLTAVMAVLVGALALGVSVYTARLQQKQVRGEVWPHLAIVHNSAERSLRLVNKGVGPAHLAWTTMAVGDATVTGWSELFGALGLSSEALGDDVVTSLEPQMLAAGESVPALQFASDAGWQAFQSARGKLRITVCYCSVLEECRVRGAEAAGFANEDWLDACPAPPRPPFTGG